MSHYRTLGVEPDATPAQIKRAYRRLASHHHPDRDGGSPEAMQAVNRAYDVLSDPERRARYDASGDDTPPRDIVADEARQIVMGVFDVLIQQGTSTDIVGDARASLAQGRAQLDQQHAGFKATLARLQKQQGKVRAKAGDNLFEDLLAQRIAAAQQAIEKAQHGERVHAATVVLLDNYECDVDMPPEPPAPAGFRDRGVENWLYQRARR